MKNRITNKLKNAIIFLHLSNSIEVAITVRFSIGLAPILLYSEFNNIMRHNDNFKEWNGTEIETKFIVNWYLFNTKSTRK